MSNYFQGFVHQRWCRRQEFFHQRYYVSLHVGCLKQVLNIFSQMVLECESLGISSSEGTISICATLTTNIAVQETSCAPQIGLVERITSPLSRTKSVFWCALCVKYFLGVQVNTEHSGVIPFSLQNTSGF